MLEVRVARIIAKQQEYIGLLKNVARTLRKVIHEGTLAGRVARIIARQKEYIGLLRKCYQNIHKSKKCLKAREARAANHGQSKGIHKSTANRFPKHMEK